jgi:cytochrome b561
MKIKYLAVLVAAIIHWILGGVWYGVFFTNAFMSRITPQQLQRMQSQKEGMALGIAFIMSLVLCYILAHFVQYTKAKSAMAGAQTAFWLWLGFIVTTNIAIVLFEGRPRGLFLINVAYQFVACIVAGVILAVWRTREPQEVAVS